MTSNPQGLGLASAPVDRGRQKLVRTPELQSAWVSVGQLQHIGGFLCSSFGMAEISLHPQPTMEGALRPRLEAHPNDHLRSAARRSSARPGRRRCRARVPVSASAVGRVIDPTLTNTAQPADENPRLTRREPAERLGRSRQHCRPLAGNDGGGSLTRHAAPRAGGCATTDRGSRARARDRWRDRARR